MLEKILIICFIAFVSYYIINSIFYFNLSKKIKYKNVWVSFIPLYRYKIYLKAINKNWISTGLLLIPFLNILMLFLWDMELLRKFKKNELYTLTNLIPILGPIIYIFIKVYTVSSKKSIYSNKNAQKGM